MKEHTNSVNRASNCLSRAHVCVFVVASLCNLAISLSYQRTIIHIILKRSPQLR